MEVLRIEVGIFTYEVIDLFGTLFAVVLIRGHGTCGILCSRHLDRKSARQARTTQAGTDTAGVTDAAEVTDAAGATDAAEAQMLLEPRILFRNRWFRQFQG